MRGDVRLMMVGDVHVSDRPPSTRKSSYRNDILTKLMELKLITNTEHFDAAVFVGDIFHSKKPGNTSHETVRAVAQILEGFSCPVYILPGNHDYAGRNHESLSKHPLGTVSLMPNVTLFGTDKRPTVVVAGKTGWTSLYGVREEDGLEAFTKAPEGGIVVAHSAIFPPGQAPEVWDAWDARQVREQFGFTDIAAGRLPKELPAIVYYGHIHEPHGAYDVDGVEFVNYGAISRGSLHEEGALTRTPGVGIIEIDEDGSYEIRERKLEHVRPADEVFRIEEVTAERAQDAENNAFAEALSAAELDVFSVEKATSAISEHPGVDQSVRDRAIELIEAVTG